MSETLCVTVLVENSVHQRGLIAEHGLSFHIQCGPHSLLFVPDCGKLFRAGA